MSPMVAKFRKLLHLILCVFLVEVVVILLDTETLEKPAKKKDEDKLHIVLKSFLLNELNINKWI